MKFDFAGLIVLFGFGTIFISLLLIKSQQANKPKDQDW